MIKRVELPHLSTDGDRRASRTEKQGFELRHFNGYLGTAWRACIQLVSKSSVISLSDQIMYTANRHMCHLPLLHICHRLTDNATSAPTIMSKSRELSNAILGRLQAS